MSLIAPSLAAPSLAPLFFTLPSVYVTMLTIEDGSIVASADSYVAISDVATYATRYGRTWSPASDLVAEQAILNAMIFIEAYEDRLCGQRVSGTQTLSWPREYVKDARGTAYLSETAIPSGVTNALCEAATIELATPGVLTAAVESGDIGVKRKRDKLGPLETEVEYQHRNKITRTQYIRIEEFLKPYICDGVSNGRVYRA
jgi:hypothetical protein